MFLFFILIYKIKIPKKTKIRIFGMIDNSSQKKGYIAREVDKKIVFSSLFDKNAYFINNCFDYSKC